MKKSLLVVLSGFLMLSIASCGDEPEPKPTEKPNEDLSSEEIKESEQISSEIINYYTVTFNDELGNKLKDVKVKEGDKAPTFEYDVKDDQEWDYTMEGWASSLDGEVISKLPDVTKDVTYFAKVSKVKQQYTINFVSNGGSETSSITANYGDLINEVEKPTYENHKFMGWCVDSSLNTLVEWPITLKDNMTLYASYNEMVKTGQYLKELLSDFNLNPYSYIPEPMRVAYKNNLVNQNDLVNDYTSFVNKNDITMNGFGEQWNMVSDNLNQSSTFFKALGVIEGLASTSIVAFNNYLDKNPSDTAHHSFKEGIYSITIDFKDNNLTYVVDYTGDFKLFGTQKAQIAMTYNIESKEKAVRIQLGDANALKYIIKENHYEFGIRYLGVRRAFFMIDKKEDGSVTGHINEYLTIKGVGLHSAADFYIDDTYTTVVGNKASGIPGFTGYIVEVYDSKTGKMLGYEVKEILKKIEYNTLWFDLNHVNGINSVKYLPKTEQDPSKLFINNMTKEFENKLVGGFSLKTASRRFDIEFRKQYFYSYDAINDEYLEIETMVPMLFVQEENMDTFTKDMMEKNNVNASISLNAKHLNKIQESYKTLIDVFIKDKDLITEEIILEFIGSAIIF